MPAVRSLMRFLRPRRTARRVPLGRLTILVQLMAVLVFLGYTLQKNDVRLPFLSDRYEIELVLDDGSGLDAEDEPPVGIAGILSGRVVDVRYERGRAIATLDMEGDTRGRIFRDATARLRPITAIQNIGVNIHAGTPSAGTLEEGGRIEADRSVGYVTTDRILEVLDADTRAWTQILVLELERGLRGRGGELESAIAELGPLTDSSAQVADALADRRRLLAKLVRELDVVFGTLGERGRQLEDVVSAGEQTLSTTAAREDDLAEIFRRLPPTLSEAQRALAGVRELSAPLSPALERLRPAARALPGGLRSLHEFVPEGRGLLRDLGALARDGRGPVKDLRRVSGELRPAATALEPSVRKLLPLLEPINEDKRGIGQIVDNWSGILSTNDAGGVRTRGITLKYEDSKPENFGLPPSSDEKRAGQRYSEVDLKVAAAFDRLCAEVNTIACLVRFRIPGTPGYVPFSTERDGGGQ